MNDTTGRPTERRPISETNCTNVGKLTISLGRR